MNPIINTIPTTDSPGPANPFARDIEGSRRNIAAYKVLTLLSFFLQFITTIYYNSPTDGNHAIFVSSPSCTSLRR